jgi:hypothetical protein
MMGRAARRERQKEQITENELVGTDLDCDLAWIIFCGVERQLFFSQHDLGLL